jgi:hypothetical protein
MKTINRRIGKLQNQFGITKNYQRMVLLVTDEGGRRGLEDENCIRILDEGGFLAQGGFVLVDLMIIPIGLNAEDTERFARDNGARICRRGAQRQGEDLEHAAGSRDESAPAGPVRITLVSPDDE